MIEKDDNRVSIISELEMDEKDELMLKIIVEFLHKKKAIKEFLIIFLIIIIIVLVCLNAMGQLQASFSSLLLAPLLMASSFHKQNLNKNYIIILLLSILKKKKMFREGIKIQKNMNRTMELKEWTLYKIRELLCHIKIHSIKFE
ncbi:hypothetical protein LOAG_12317 [Loa loa]|uniref:Uncharacterized protein n=1 Tax=Loa loa TaxID=7209 RepID=A0A1S0TLH8_LOALO|nr:hypothetical protein LOAG_12317 [Loa loa]EFO16191.1 hypothetical protein LOAG_12317 [Loa loa]